MEPIITPEIEALLQRYTDATASLLQTAGKPVSAADFGTFVHSLLEVVFALENEAVLLAEKMRKDDGSDIPRISVWSVRHSVISSIARVLKQRVNEIVPRRNEAVSP